MVRVATRRENFFTWGVAACIGFFDTVLLVWESPFQNSKFLIILQAAGIACIDIEVERHNAFGKEKGIMGILELCLDEPG